MTTSKQYLVAVALFEGIIIIFLVVSGTHVVVKKQISPISVKSPIALALEYDAPDKKFEEVVKKNRGWLSYRLPFASTGILADCADQKRTNYVRILIENGADVEEAEKQLREVNREEAIKLLREVQSELNHK
jgi:hypothetical protein